MEKTIRDLVFRMMGCSAEAADVADVCGKAVSVITEGDVCLVVEDESLLNKLRAATDVVSIAPDDRRPFVLAESRLYTRRNWHYEAQARERAMEMAGTGGDMIVYRHLREEGMTNPDSWPEFIDIITRSLRPFTEAKTAEEALFYLNVFRILCVERHGAFGINRVNEYMVRKLAGSLRHPHCPIPIMITRNDKSLNVANGDVGVRMPDNPSNICLLVEESKEPKDIQYRKVRTELLDNVEMAFAMTVHKSRVQSSATWPSSCRRTPRADC